MSRQAYCITLFLVHCKKLSLFNLYSSMMLEPVMCLASQSSLHYCVYVVSKLLQLMQCLSQKSYIRRNQNGSIWLSLTFVFYYLFQAKMFKTNHPSFLFLALIMLLFLNNILNYFGQIDQVLLKYHNSLLWSCSFATILNLRGSLTNSVKLKPESTSTSLSFRDKIEVAIIVGKEPSATLRSFIKQLLNIVIIIISSFVKLNSIKVAIRLLLPDLICLKMLFVSVRNSKTRYTHFCLFLLNQNRANILFLHKYSSLSYLKLKYVMRKMK